MNDMIHLDLGAGRLEVSAQLLATALINRLREPAPARPALRIGEYVPGQGGVYGGDIRGDDGVTYGLIVGDADLAEIQFGGYGDEIEGSSWDGLNNTAALLKRGGHAAASAAADHSADGHTDFYLPAKRELQIVAANLPDLFKQERYWTSTPYGSYDAWAVDFECGLVFSWYRNDEFRVRPFRRFSY